MDTHTKDRLASLLSAVPEPIQPPGLRRLSYGDHAKKSMELVMLIHYDYLYFQFLRMIKEGKRGGSYFNHLCWLLQQGDNRVPEEHCQWCGHDSFVAAFLSAGNEYDGHRVSAKYLCCGRPECEERLLEISGWEDGIFYPICFSSIIAFTASSDRRVVTDLLRGLFGLGRKMKSEELFKFFAAPPPR